MDKLTQLAGMRMDTGIAPLVTPTGKFPNNATIMAGACPCNVQIACRIAARDSAWCRCPGPKSSSRPEGKSLVT